MSAEANKELARRVFEEMFNGRHNDLAETLLTQDHVYHDPQIPNVVGPQAMAQAVSVYQNGLEGHWGIEEIIAGEGDHVTVRWTGTGTHNAEMMDVPPTGKSVRVSAISVLRIADGKVADHWCCWDTLGMLQQLGVAPTQ